MLVKGTVCQGFVYCGHAGFVISRPNIECATGASVFKSTAISAPGRRDLSFLGRVAWNGAGMIP